MSFFPKTPEEKLKLKNDVVKCLLAELIVLIVIGFVLILEKILGKQTFDNLTYILCTLIASTMFLVIIIMAGFAVMKSLFLVAAWTSLLLFLSQSYCTANNRTTLSDDALKYILIIGFLYIIISFFRSLWKELNEGCKFFNESDFWGRILFIIIFIALIIFFIWQIYLVVSPIVQNLCIYK